jgi:RNA polymerase sigma factor (sigma-70 family)
MQPDNPTEAEIQQAIARAKAYARKFTERLPAWMDQDAFFGEALLAVALALQSYNPDRGAALPTWIHTRVRYALLDEQRRQDPVSRVRRRKLLTGEVEEEPTDLIPLSLDALRADRGERLDQVLAQAPDPALLLIEQEEEETRQVTLEAALLQLTDAEREVLQARYFDDLTLYQTARTLQLTQPRVAALERSALAKLRPLLTAPET